MRIIAIIAVVIMILTFPVHIQRNEILNENVQGKFSYYNFTSLADGSFPKNSSHFDFSLYGARSNFTVGGSRGIIQGLSVRSDHYSLWSFLKIGLNLSAVKNVSLLFSWNNRLSAGLTENYITVSSGQNLLLNLSFGDASGYASIINASGNKTKIPYEPPMNALDILSIVLDTNTSDIYVEEKSIGSGNFSFPIGFLDDLHSSPDDLNLSIGGQYTNVTLYNISARDRMPAIIASEDSGNGSLHLQKDLQESFPYGLFVNYSGQNLFNERTNSILFVAEDGSIHSYNYYNHTDSLIYNPENASSIRWISGLNTPQAYIYAFNYGINADLVSIRKIARDISVMGVKSPGGYPFYLQHTGNQIMWISGDGSIEMFNSSSLMPLYGFRLPDSSPNLTILSGSLHSENYDLSLYNGKNRTVTRYSISLETYAFSIISKSRISPFVGSLHVTSTSSTSVNISSSISYSGGTDMVMGEHFRIIPGFGYATQLIALSSGGSSLLSTSGGFLCLSGGGIFQRISLPRSEQVRAWYGGSVAFIAQSGEVFILNFSTTSPFSEDHINFTHENHYVLTGRSIVHIGINSSLPYSVYVKIDNVTFASRNENVSVNSTLFPNGHYTMEITATNLAGYSDIKRVASIVDNGVPALDDSLQNESFVSNSTVVNYTVNWTLGVKSMYVSYLGMNYSLKTGNGSFHIMSGNFSGRMGVSIVLIDEADRVFKYNYSETVIWNDPDRYRISVWNGEYFNTTHINVNWSALNYAYLYTIKISGFASSVSVNTTATHQNLSLSNGRYDMSVLAHLDNGSSITIGSASFTIITFAPGISVSHSEDRAYSFLGNSVNNTLFYEVTSNVSSLISYKIFRPGGSLLTAGSGWNSINITISGGNLSMRMNGLYTILIRATGLSHLATTTRFEFLVNNTIPENPAADNGILYRNVSVIRFHNPIKNARYTVEFNNTTWTMNYKNWNGTIYLNHGNGRYSVTLKVFSNSMNYNSSSFTVIFFNRKPVISYLHPQKENTTSSSISIAVSVRDRAPLWFIAIYVDGLEMYKNYSAGNVFTHHLKFDHNGNYTVDLVVVDRCGNENTSLFHVSVKHFPHLYSNKVSVLNLFILQHITVKLSGINTSGMEVSWYVNGKERGSGLSLLSILPLGYNSVDVEITYGNISIRKHTEVFSVGIIGQVVAGALILISVISRKLRGVKDARILESFLKECDGLSVRNVISVAKKKGLNVPEVRVTMKNMVENNRAYYDVDPDGVRYIKMRKQ